MSEVGLKYDQGKPDLTLLESMRGALAEVARVLEFGAKKYKRDGWQHVENGEARYKAAALRHALEPLGELDSESGLLHAAHQACSILFAIQIHLNNKNAPVSKIPNAIVTRELLRKEADRIQELLMDGWYLHTAQLSEDRPEKASGTIRIRLEDGEELTRDASQVYWGVSINGRSVVGWKHG